ncbi:MAG: phage tail tape measure protein [Acidobacterium ailaaui]|nr:phage tail tape measure protein [Pseudacidobacterium ailaaui]
MPETVGSIKAEIVLRNEQFKRKVDESKRKVNELNASAKTASGGVKKLGDSSDQASKGVSKLGEKSNKVSKDIKAIHKASLAVGAAVAAGIGGTVAIAANFEQKLKDIQAVSGATQSEMQQLHDLAVEMGAKTKFSAAEAAQGIEELIKAGVSLKDIINGGLEGALNLAVAGELNLGEAAQVASTALNAFRKDNLKVSDAANILAGAANASATDVREMTQGLAQASAVASGMGMSFRDTSIALAVFAQNGLRGSDAGTSLKTMLLNLVPQTKQQIKLFKELGLITKDGSNAFYDAHGNLKSLSDIAGILQEKLKGMTNEQRQATLQILFGTDAVRAANILYKEGADGVQKMWDAMSNVTAADVAKTKMESLKGSFEQFKGALETLGITIGEEFLPSFKKIVDGATDLVEWLGKANPKIVSTGLEASAAAAGVGLLLSAIVKITTAMRAFALTPAGAVITALSVLTGLAIGFRNSLSDANEVTLESIQAQQKEAQQLDQTIDQFEELRAKNQLSNAEMLRFMDINSELAKTSSPDKIKALKDEQDKLLKKSGLSNDEMQRFIDLNKKIIDASPETERAISKEGNALAKNADAAKKANQAKLELLATETRAKFIETLNDMEEKLKKEKELINDIKSLEKAREKTMDTIRDAEDRIVKANETIDKYKGSQNKKDQQRVAYAYSVKIAAEQELESQRKALEVIAKKLAKKQEELTATRKDIKALDETAAQYEQIVLAQVGLNSKRGEGLKVLQNELNKLEQEKAQLGLLYSHGKLTTEEYQKQVNKIDTQIGRIKTAQSNLREMNQIAGKTVYKDVKIKTSPSAESINKKYGSSITKSINLTIDEQRYKVGMERVYQQLKARGLVRHQGGIVTDPSDELTKFHEGGSPAFRTPPMFNEVDVRLLRNEMVLTEGQQANLWRMLENYAASPNTSSADLEATNTLLARIEYAIKNAQGDVVIEVNGREFARATEKDMSREQGRAVRQTKRRRGVI